MIKLEKTYFSTIYNAFGYSPGGTYITKKDKKFFVINSRDKKKIKELNKLHPCFGIEKIKSLP